MPDAIMSDNTAYEVSSYQPPAVEAPGLTIADIELIKRDAYNLGFLHGCSSRAPEVRRYRLQRAELSEQFLTLRRDMRTAINQGLMPIICHLKEPDDKLRTCSALREYMRTQAGGINRVVEALEEMTAP